MVEVRVCREIRKGDGDVGVFKKDQSTQSLLGRWKGKSKKSKSDAQIGGKKRERMTKKVQHLMAVTEVLPFVQYELHKQVWENISNIMARRFSDPFDWKFPRSYSYLASSVSSGKTLFFG
jgi:hypothetical protein